MNKDKGLPDQLAKAWTIKHLSERVAFFMKYTAWLEDLIEEKLKIDALSQYTDEQKDLDKAFDEIKKMGFRI